MSQPVSLSSLFIRASIRTVRFAATGTTALERPPSGKRWILLGGQMVSAGATACGLYLYAADGNTIVHCYFNRTSTGAGNFPIFDSSTNWTPTVITDRDVLQLVKPANDYAVVQVLEW